MGWKAWGEPRRCKYFSFYYGLLYFHHEGVFNSTALLIIFMRLNRIKGFNIYLLLHSSFYRAQASQKVTKACKGFLGPDGMSYRQLFISLTNTPTSAHVVSFS